jgi:hypothetical protein
MVHIITTNDSKGISVVKYFTAGSDTLPMACGSFIRGPGDGSRLAVECARWGNDGGVHYVGKWGHFNKNVEWRMYDHTLFVANEYHWVVRPSLYRCDGNTASISPGDFWKIYVR